MAYTGTEYKMRNERLSKKDIACYLIVSLLIILTTIEVDYFLEKAEATESIAEIIQNVKNVRMYVNASSYGFNKENSTMALQQAIDSGAERVIVPYMGEDWIVEPINLRSDLEIIFEKGVVVTAKKGSFTGKNDCLFKGENLENVKLTGCDAILKMRKNDYLQGPYTKSEWRMGLCLLGCKNVEISGLEIYESGGDGLYISSSPNGNYQCSDVQIKNCRFHNNYRQGLSIISGRDITVENCVFSNTIGTWPQSGIDLEPNNYRQELSNIHVKNCRFESNAGNGIQIHLSNVSKKTNPISILFEDCIIDSNNLYGVQVGPIPDDGPEGTVEFRNCEIINTRLSAIRIVDKSKKSASLTFDGMTLKNNAVKRSFLESKTNVPILLNTEKNDLVTVMGGILFKNCIIYDSQKRPFLSYYQAGEAVELDDITGDFTIHSEYSENIEDEYLLEKSEIRVQWVR